MKRIRRPKSNKKLVLFLIPLILLVPLVLLFPRNAQAAWFDTNWAYRQPITVTVASNGSDITNLETLITLSGTTAPSTLITASKLQSSCQDLRFTNATGKLLPYYIDTSPCNASSVKVWVMADLVPKNVTSYTIYVYYGNPSALAGSDATKFRLFNGLAGYWTMNESSWTVDCSTTSVIDSSINGNSAKACPNSTGPAGGATGKYSNGGSFDGTNDYVDATDPANGSLDFGSGSFTVSAWFKTSDSGTALDIVAKRPASDNTQGWRIVKNTGNLFSMRISDGGTDKIPVNTATVNNNAFHLGLVVVNRTTNTATAYVDGVAGTPVDISGLGSVSNASPFTIGSTGGTSRFFNGSIDDVRVYTRALSQEEITQLFNNPGNIASNSTSNSKPSVTFGTETQAPGPVLYWKFDDATGTTAKDSSSSNNSGTLGGTTIPTWQTEDQCISGKCLFFDGSSSKVTGSAVIKAIQSVSFWVRPNTIATQGLLNLDGGTHKISTNGSGVISATGFTSPTYYINGVAQTSPTLVLNQWNFVEITTGTNFDTTSSFTLGTDGTNFIKGFIDEVKFDKYARSAPQVQSDYNSRGSILGAANAFGTGFNNQYSALNQGLVAYYKMDESSGNTSDSSGNGNTGTNTGTTTYTAGKFGNAGTFDGANQYFTVADSTSDNVTGSGVTISAWVNPTSQPSTAEIFKKDSQYILRMEGNDIKFITWANTTQDYLNYTVGTITNKWTHIVVTYDGNDLTASTMRLYVNGVYVTPSSVDAVQRGNLASASNSIGVGAQAGGGENFAGQIDELRLYNRALSAQDVQNLYNFAPGPVGYYNFEEKTGSSVNDRSGGGNTGTWQGTLGSQWTTGKYGAGGNFNGTNNYVSVANTIGGVKTVSFWVNPTSTTANLFDLDGGTHYITSSAGTLSANGFSTPSIYVNGVLNGTLSANTWNFVSVITATAISSSAITIGKANGSFTAEKIDEVRLYNYAQTQKQIVSDMGAGSPSAGSGRSAVPIGYWKFAEGTDNTCSGGTNDACNAGNAGNGLDLAESGMAVPATSTSGWTNSGKFGKALIFDGSNDYLATSGNPNALKLTSNLTLSAWINLTDISAARDIIAKDGASGNFGYRIYVDTAGKLNMELSSDGTATTTVTGNRIMSTGTWYHVVGVYIPSTSITLYINGNQDKQTTSSIPSSIFNSTANLNIGGQNAGTNLMNGYIDEPKVYNYDLYPSEVLLDYNRNASEVLGAVSDNSSYQLQAANQAYCVPGDSTSCASPVSEWNFEEKTGSSVFDNSGNGNTGTWQGTLGSQWKTGKYGTGGNFNGSDNFVDAGDTASQEITGALTLSGWVYLNNKTAAQVIVSKSGNPATNKEAYVLEYLQTSDRWLLAVSNNGATFTSVLGTSSPSTGQWYFVEGVYIPSTSMKIYVNGVLENTNTTSIPASINNTISHVNLGSQIGGTTALLNGKLDQVRIWNYARSAAQAAWDYNRGGPVGWWKLDDCQGTTAIDSSGNGRTATESIGATTLGNCNTSSSFWGGSGGTGAGKINYAPTFDGTDDNMTTSAFSPLASAGKTTTTLSWGGWFFPTSSAASKTLIEKATEFQLTTNASSQPLCGVYYSGAFHNSSAPSTALTLSAWNHILCVYDGTNINTYLNGILIKQSSETNSVTAASSILYLAETSGGANFYQGQIDDFRIYSYALTPTQIRDIYNGGAATFRPLTGAP